MMILLTREMEELSNCFLFFLDQWKSLLSQIVERLLFLQVMMVWKVLREAVVLDHDCCSFLSPETVLLLSLKTVSDIITLTQHQDDDDDTLTLVNSVHNYEQAKTLSFTRAIYKS